MHATALRRECLPDVTISPPPPRTPIALHHVGGLYIVAIWLRDRVAHAGAETRAEAIAIVAKFANSAECEKVGAWIRGEEYDRARAVVHWSRSDERKA